MSFTKTWNVYGAPGHRQRVSFFKSCIDDFSTDGNIRILETICSDITGTNDFVTIRITRNTEKECDEEFWGQLSDGIFENSRIGKIEEVI